MSYLFRTLDGHRHKLGSHSHKTGKLQEAVDHLVRAPFVSGLFWCHVDEFLGYLHLDFSAHRVEPRPP